MSNLKVTGAVEIPKGTNSARVRIISLRRGGEFITDPPELRKTFPPEGYVFANSIRDRFEDNALIEFIATENKKSINSSDDQFVMEKSAPFGRAGCEVFQVPDSVMIDGTTIDLDAVNQFIEDVDENFYILVGEALIGPFKLAGDQIEGCKEVYQINRSEHIIHHSGDRMYLLRKVTGDTKYDCMTKDQLSEWFKNQLKNQELSVDFKELKSALLAQGASGLDKVRIQRAMSMLDQLELGLADFKTIAAANTDLPTIFASAVERAREEFIKPLKDEAAAIRDNNRELAAISSQHQALIVEQTLQLATNSKDLEHLQQEKDRLIADIRAHALIQMGSLGRQEALVTYEERHFNTTGQPYPSLMAFVDEFTHEPAQKKLALNAIIQMREFSCIFSAALSPIIHIAALTNNCRVFIQQVEPDWLKFESFYNNGLKQSWAAAQANPQVIHFLILEDLNMASFECYGRPLSDLLTGVRKTLPGIRTEFPKNLWIFGIPLQSYQDNNFGLPLLRETFAKWGAFPSSGLGLSASPTHPEFSLSLELLTAHDMIGSVAMADYFPEI